jgi:N-acetylglucosaminyldiphosphoundecaprenol N-acetyl-beta-D-mannosaminyltransferase
LERKDRGLFEKSSGSGVGQEGRGHAVSAEVEIHGLGFPVVGYEEVLELFMEWLGGDRRPRQVCTVNVHTFVTAQQDTRLAEVYRDAALLTMDGQPVRWYANLVLRAGARTTVSGPELMARCVAAGRERGWSHYLLGGRPEVLPALEARLVARFPGVRIVGRHSPPFRPLTAAEDDELIAEVNESGADFLWVGLGAPKQEVWIAERLGRIRVPIQIGVGAAFDFHAGVVRRAPAALQRMGLEWLYRLWQEPRLLGRYASTNPVFLGMLLKDAVRVRLLGRETL